MTQEEDIHKAVEVLRRGGTILYPTDTVWGIGCDATNARAVERVCEIKRRTDPKALICLVDSDKHLARYARNLTDLAWDLITLATTPTTVVVDGILGLAENVYAEDGSLGVRLTSEPFSKALCYAFERPIVSTSANVTGQQTPQNYDDIAEEILSAVDYVCESRRREQKVHHPSKIIKLTNNGEITIIRQ